MKFDKKIRLFIINSILSHPPALIRDDTECQRIFPLYKETAAITARYITPHDKLGFFTCFFPVYLL